MANKKIHLLAGLAVLALIVSTLGSGVSATRAQTESQTFPETGKTVKGKFYVYWKEHGGLPQQGFPISDEIQEVSDTNGKTYTVQYFERAVFEAHPENQAPYDILLSLLGNFQYKASYPYGAPNQKASTDNVLKFDAKYTSKVVGGKFRAYWEKNGGLSQQGYPISDEFQEKSDLDGKVYTVQYFERAVFELHPENQAPYDVLLSQLGLFRHRAKYQAATNYNQIIESSKNEKDGLLIYSIMSTQNWAPVIAGFNAKYPWIKVTTTDLGAYEVFQRYYTEAAGNARTGDFIATTAPDGWIDFANKGEVQNYLSNQDYGLPKIGKIGKGIYAVSTDPMVFIWNKALLPNPPKTMAELVSQIKADPNQYAGKITSYDAAGEGFGYGLNWYYTKAKGEAGWKDLETIGSTRPKILTSGGRMIDSVIAGETILGYFVSNITVQPRLAQASQILGYSFVPDAQVVAVRGMAVTKRAASPNSAKLMLDYILSNEGQINFGKGGLTSYQPDVATQSPLHIDQVIKAVGGVDKIIYAYPDAELADPAKHNAFLTRWKQALQRP